MHRAPRHQAITLNLAPMVDVMMCLLIFFMVATRMVQEEQSRVNLPPAQTADLRANQTEDASRLVINIEQAKGIAEGCTYVIREQVLTLDQVGQKLQDASHLSPDATCLIRADKGVPYRAVDAVLIGCARAGITRVSFGALQSDEDDG